MPDITMLPILADYFCVSVDILMGLCPMPEEMYKPVNTDKGEYWEARLEFLKATRSYLWNDDYLSFLVRDVWKLSKPVRVLDCGCGFGYLGDKLLKQLPNGSTYTGIDLSKGLIKEAKSYLSGLNKNIRLIQDDFLTCEMNETYDLVICQSVLRHNKKPLDFIKKMAACASVGGLVVCIEANRELECAGIWIDGINYSQLCAGNALRRLWKNEFEKEGRDYAIAMRIPNIMAKIGLRSIGCRLSDRVDYLHTQMPDSDERMNAFFVANGWDKVLTEDMMGRALANLMERGMTREEAMDYCQFQQTVERYVHQQWDIEDLACTTLAGMLVTYGTK